MGTFCRWSSPFAKCVRLKNSHFWGRKHPLRRELQHMMQPKLEGGKWMAPAANPAASMLQVKPQQEQQGTKHQPRLPGKAFPEHSQVSRPDQAPEPSHALPSEGARLQQDTGTCGGFDVQTPQRGLEKGELEMQEEQLSCSTLAANSCSFPTLPSPSPGNDHAVLDPGIPANPPPKGIPKTSQGVCEGQQEGNPGAAGRQ